MKDATTFCEDHTPDEKPQPSLAAQARTKFFRLFTRSSAALPLVPALLLLLLIIFAEPVLAQSVLNGDSSKPVRAVRSAVNVAMWATLAMGIFGLCWAGWNKTTGKAWGGQAAGGAICLGISGVISFVNQLVNGEAPDLADF